MLVTGGAEGSAAQATTLESAESYDPATRTFRVVGPMDDVFVELFRSFKLLPLDT